MTINDISFRAHGCGIGFESETIFENNHRILIVCGPAVYNREGADTEDRPSALQYTTFEYQYINPTLLPELGPWTGPVDLAGINAKIAEVKALPLAPEPGQGGNGE